MNYYNEMMELGFEAIVKHSFPDDLDEIQRIELLHYFIQHFQDKDDFEKCYVLKERMNDVMAPVKIKRGRPRKKPW